MTMTITIHMLKKTFVDLRFNNEEGEELKINTVLRQRRILSPSLFNFHTKGCIEDIVNHNVGCRI